MSGLTCLLSAGSYLSLLKNYHDRTDKKWGHLHIPKKYVNLSQHEVLKIHVFIQTNNMEI